MKLRKLIAQQGRPNVLLFHCPGCGCGHQVHVAPERNDYTGATWGWNGSMERPTFTPSIKVTWAWGENRVPHCCHSFVTDGNIQFLSDCTHKLAGQTVPLPDRDEERVEISEPATVVKRW